jgi:hypothetical protein
MSFGFSVGDFVAVGKLIVEIISSLQTIGGAKSEYQELIREFESLNAALRHLDRLDHGATHSQIIGSIKYTALSCRVPLEDFLTKIKKYDRSLGLWSQSSRIKTVPDKVRWSFGRNDEIRRLQTYLNVHIGTINILLAEHNLEQMNLHGRKADVNAHQVRQQLDTTNVLLGKFDKHFSGQAMLLRGVHSMLGSLYSLVCGDMKTSLQHFCQVINKVW